MQGHIFGQVVTLYQICCTKTKKHLRTQVLFSMKRTLRCMKSEAGLRPMKRGFAAWRGTGASRLLTANASSPIMLLSRVKSLRRRVNFISHFACAKHFTHSFGTAFAVLFFLSCIVKNPKNRLKTIRNNKNASQLQVKNLMGFEIKNGTCTVQSAGLILSFYFIQQSHRQLLQRQLYR